MNSEIEVTITIDNNDKTATVYASKAQRCLASSKGLQLNTQPPFSS